MQDPISQFLHDPISPQGAEPIGNTAREFTAFIESEKQKYDKLIKEAGIKGE